MSLYVIEVPSPAPGVDWRTTVPGQYVWHVTGITATLDTITAPTSTPDSSGNGLDLAIMSGNANTTWGAAGPYAGGSGDYAVHGAQVFPHPGRLQSVGSALFDTPTTTVEAWVNLDAPPDVLNSAFATMQNVAGNIRWGFGFPAANDDPARVTEYQGGIGVTIGLAFLPRAGWHHVAFVADGAQWLAYLDGVLTFTFPGRQPVAALAPYATVFNTEATGNDFRGSVAGVAVFPGALSGAQIATHAAASGTAAAYKAAVLADVPTALWMLDTLNAGVSRTVTLEITDGTSLVASYPAAFPTGTVGTALTFSWQPAGTASTQTPSQAVTTVAIPELVLPAGYTVGVRTLDLAAADRWSDINLWWSTDRMDGGGTVNPWQYPPGALLKFVQRE